MRLGRGKIIYFTLCTLLKNFFTSTNGIYTASSIHLIVNSINEGGKWLDRDRSFCSWKIFLKPCVQPVIWICSRHVCSTLGKLVSRAGSKRDFHPATFSPYTSFFVYHLCFNFFPRNGVIRRCIPDVTVKRRDSDMVWRTDGYSCYGCKNGIATQIFYFVPLKTWNEDSYKFKNRKERILIEEISRHDFWKRNLFQYPSKFLKKRSKKIRNYFWDKNNIRFLFEHIY